MKILLAAATVAEIAPTVDWLKKGQTDGEVEVLITGVGMMATAFALTRTLMHSKYDLVIGAGIAGAFDTSIALGECVVVWEEQAGDLGAEDHEKFLDVMELGLMRPDEAPFKGGRLPNNMSTLPFDASTLKKVSGLTVNAVSGSTRTIEARLARSGAAVESMEGAALHYVCLQLDQPFIQLRAISNYVTPRDRSSWKIGQAVMALNAQLITWLKLPA